jgi:hypothetical protein
VIILIVQITIRINQSIKEVKVVDKLIGNQAYLKCT